MKKLISLCFAVCFSFLAFSQSPTNLGTSVANGTYQSYALFDLCAFSQVRIQASSSGTGRQWEFYTCSCGGGCYDCNWRPYTSGLTLAVFNQQILPVGGTASALFNSGFGGQTALLPAVTAGNYYTFNIEDANGAINHNMSVLETSYNPVLITGVSQPSAISCLAQTIQVTTNNPLSNGEYMFIRYSTDNFVTSTIVPVTMGNQTIGTGTIPALAAGATVKYYAFTSNQVSPTHVTADMLTLSISNNSCANYTYTVPTAPTATITGNLNLCTGSNTLLSAATSAPGSGTLTNYQWMNGPVFPTNNITNATSVTYKATAAGTYYVRVTNSNGCSSISAANAVTAVAPPAAPTVVTPVNYCLGVVPIDLTTNASGTNILWYNQSVGGVGSGIIPTPSTTIIGTTSYYATQTNAAGCESPRAKVDVIVANAPQITYQVGCSYATIAASGCSGTITAIDWLDDASSAPVTGATITTSLTAGTSTIKCKAGTYKVKVTCSGITACNTTITSIVIP